MEKISRTIGMGLYSVLNEQHISIAEAAERVGFSFRDMRRLIEGRLVVSPRVLEEIAEKFNTSAEYLIYYKPDDNNLLPGLEYNKKFTDKENLYRIIDFIDDYVLIKEMM